MAIPDAMPIAHAALAEPVAVCWHAVRLGMERLARPLAAARVVVLGGGAIGLGAALVARLFGAGDIRVAEPNPLRRQAVARGEGLDAYDPSGPAAPAESSVDLVIDAVGAAATRAAACAMVRPGGVIVHAGLLPGHEGLDVRKITLQEITLTGTYCYTPTDFTDAVEALASGRLGRLAWFETRPLAAGPAAFRDIDAGAAPAKLVLTP